MVLVGDANTPSSPLTNAIQDSSQSVMHSGSHRKCDSLDLDSFHASGLSAEAATSPARFPGNSVTCKRTSSRKKILSAKAREDELVAHDLHMRSDNFSYFSDEVMSHSNSVDDDTSVGSFGEEQIVYSTDPAEFAKVLPLQAKEKPAHTNTQIGHVFPEFPNGDPHKRKLVTPETEIQSGVSGPDLPNVYKKYKPSNSISKLSADGSAKFGQTVASCEEAQPFIQTPGQALIGNRRTSPDRKPKSVNERKLEKRQKEIEVFRNRMLNMSKPGLFPNVPTELESFHSKTPRLHLSMLRGADSMKKIKLQEKLLGNVKAKVQGLQEYQQLSNPQLPKRCGDPESPPFRNLETPEAPSSDPLDITCNSSRIPDDKDEWVQKLKNDILNSSIFYFAPEFFEPPDVYWWNKKLRSYEISNSDWLHVHTKGPNSSVKASYKYDSLACFTKYVHACSCNGVDGCQEFHYFKIFFGGNYQDKKFYNFPSMLSSAQRLYLDFFLATISKSSWQQVLQQIKQNELTPYNFVKSTNTIDMFDNLASLKKAKWSEFRDIFPASFVSHWLSSDTSGQGAKSRKRHFRKIAGSAMGNDLFLQNSPYECNLAAMDGVQVLLLRF